jgi:hypothetical protein
MASLGELLSGFGGQKNSPTVPTQNALNRKAQLAQMLMQGSTGTINPLVAALGSFLGTNELSNIADQQGQLDMSELRRAEEERKRKIANEERSFGLEERKLDMSGKQFEQQFALDQRRFALESKKIGAEIAKLYADSNAATPELNAQGYEITNPRQQLPTKKEAEEFRGLIGTQKNLSDIVGRLKKSVEESGTELYGAESKLQNQLFNDAKLQIKNLFELGAIQAPDIPLLESALPNPSSIGSALSLNSTLIKQYNQFNELLDSKVANKASTLGFTKLNDSNDGWNIREKK